MLGRGSALLPWIMLPGTGNGNPGSHMLPTSAGFLGAWAGHTLELEAHGCPVAQGLGVSGVSSFVCTEHLSQLTLACRGSSWSCSWILCSEGEAHLGIVLSPWLVWNSLNPKYNIKCVETFKRGYTSLRNSWYTPQLHKCLIIVLHDFLS